MRRYRAILLAATLVVVGGSLGLTAWYGRHLHSESYRCEVEQDLTAFFELPCDVGMVRGNTFDSRRFEDVWVWLPDRRDHVFFCKTAVWFEEKVNGLPANRLELSDGLLVLGNDRWLREDYRQVFESGLRHDFDELDLHEVALSNFEVAVFRGDLAIRCRSTFGTIDMSNPEDGVARLVAYELNGYRVSQGVHIDARFLPRHGVEISEFVLTVPEIPFGSLGLDVALGRTPSTGRFAGQVQYRKDGDAAEVWLRGELRDLDLSEWTARSAIGTLAGRLTVSVDHARLSANTITHFRGRGQLSDISLQPLAALLGVETFAGTASFNLDPVDLALGQVNRIRLDGRVSGLTLQDILQPWGLGTATGELAVRVNNLDLAGETIRSADVEVHAVPPAGRPGTIDRALLIGAAEQLLGFTWPEAIPKRLLPEKVEYVECGFRLLVRDNQLRVLGTYGAESDTILTIRVLGQPIALLREPSTTLDVQPYLLRLIERVRAYDPERVRHWWQSGGRLWDSGSTRPATGPALDP